MGDAVVRVAHVWKRFRLGETHDSLRDLLAAGMRRVLPGRTSRPERGSFWALSDVSFGVQRGDAVGIIGPNGAGKSTALRLLAGIMRPERGEISVGGRLAALIEVGAGFHGDLTGRENIFLNGAILGMTRREIRQKLDAVIAFAGIERFIDMPVKRYSSGMYARLGFSIAAHVDPDVLLVDEVLSVGDAVFRLRCVERMRDLVRSGTTLVFVTHNLDQMQSICPRALVLDGGKAVFEGRSQEAVTHYLAAMSRTYADRRTDVVHRDEELCDTVELLSLKFVDEGGDEVVWQRASQPLRAEVTLRLRRPVRRMVVELNMRAATEENILSFNSGRGGMIFDGRVGTHQAVLTIPHLPLASGQYFWNARVWDMETGETKLDTPVRFPLVIDDEGRATGRLAVEHEWTFVSSTSTDVEGEHHPGSHAPPHDGEKPVETLHLG
ncbi:MAG: polysaccharide ABC transporter ATP-binding protein [Phycisphaerae bacterium]